MPEEVPTASTAATTKGKKDLQNAMFLGGRSADDALKGGRYLRWWSVTVLSRSVTCSNTDRMKVLRMSTLPTMRAMRSVFCWMLC